MSNNENRILTSLIDRYVSGEIDEHFLAELLRAIEEDPSLAETIYEQQYVGFWLDRHFQTESSLSLYTKIDDICQAGKQTRRSGKYKSDDLMPPKKRKWTSPLVYVGVSALVFIALSGYYFVRPLFIPQQYLSSPVFESCGEILASVDTEWNEDAIEYRTGMRYHGERIDLRSGILEISLKNHVRLVLEGPVDWVWESEKKSFCQSGKISVYVPPEAVGYELRTSDLTVRDMGTEFAVEIDSEGTKLNVTTGKVEVFSSRGFQKSFTENEAVRIDKNENILNLPIDAIPFVRHEKVQELLNENRIKRSEIGEAYVENRKKENDLLILFEFSDVKKPINNLSESINRLNVQGRLRGVSLGQGRWPSKKAAGFFSRRESMITEIPGRYPSMTLLASLKIDRLDRHCHVILTSRQVGNGSISWQFDREGALRLLYQESPETLAKIYKSRPMILPKDFGAWHQIATVVDSVQNKVSFYVNGSPWGECDFQHSGDLSIGDVEIGNLTREERSPTERYLNGSIDEIMIFSRPLDAEEIADMYDHNM